MEYVISSLQKVAPATFAMKLKPKDGEVFSFRAGQFCGIRQKNENPKGKAHFFSIASSPTQKGSIEFCFKVYGNWTQKLSQISQQESLFLSGPFGNFVWEDTLQHAVFLAGGVGITPFMSMLRFIKDTNQKPSITLFYGNRIEEHIVYKNEIDEIVNTLPNSKTVHVLSDVNEKDSWNGYRGLLTREILAKEITNPLTPTYFICGPPVFVQLAQKLLAELLVPQQNIKQELFSV